MKTYADFAKLCADLSPASHWIHTMDRRSGEPALFTYMVNAACVLATGRPAIVADYQRTGDGLAVIPGDSPAPTVAGGCVSLMIRFMERRMTSNGMWRPDLQAVLERACPEIGQAAIGDSISPEMAGMWALTMLRGDWVPTPEASPSPEMGATYVSAR